MASSEKLAPSDFELVKTGHLKHCPSCILHLEEPDSFLIGCYSLVNENSVGAVEFKYKNKRLGSLILVERNEIIREYECKNGGVFDMRFSGKKSKTFLVAHSNGVLGFYAIDDYNHIVLGHEIDTKSEMLCSLCITHTTSHIFTGDSRGRLHLVSDKTLIRSLQLPCTEQIWVLNALELRDGATILMVGSEDSKLRIYNVVGKSFSECITKIEDFGAGVTSILTIPKCDENRKKVYDLFIGSYDSLIRQYKFVVNSNSSTKLEYTLQLESSIEIPGSGIWRISPVYLNSKIFLLVAGMFGGATIIEDWTQIKLNIPPANHKDKDKEKADHCVYGFVSNDEMNVVMITSFDDRKYFVLKRNCERFNLLTSPNYDPKNCARSFKDKTEKIYQELTKENLLDRYGITAEDSFERRLYGDAILNEIQAENMKTLQALSLESSPRISKVSESTDNSPQNHHCQNADQAFCSSRNRPKRDFDTTNSQDENSNSTRVEETSQSTISGSSSIKFHPIPTLSRLRRRVMTETSTDGEKDDPDYVRVIEYWLDKKGIKKANDDDFDDPIRNDGLMLGGYTNFSEYIDKEVSRFKEEGKTSEVRQLRLYQGDFQGVIRDAMKNSELDESLVALSGSVSRAFWAETIEAYVKQLKKQFRYQEAATYLLSLGRISEAIGLLVYHKYYSHALVVAKSRSPGDDHLINDIIKSWAKHLTSRDKYEEAAKLYISIDRYQDAYKILKKSSNKELRNYGKILKNYHLSQVGEKEIQKSAERE